jgi:hypothetical protein
MKGFETQAHIEREVQEDYFIQASIVGGSQIYSFFNFIISKQECENSIIELLTLFLAFHLYSFDSKSDCLKYLLRIFIYVYDFRNGMGIHFC